MKNKTTVEWLELQIKDILEKNNIIIEDAIWNMAKDMERTQITNAYIVGERGGCSMCEDYYLKMYGEPGENIYKCR